MAYDRMPQVVKGGRRAERGHSFICLHSRVSHEPHLIIHMNRRGLSFAGLLTAGDWVPQVVNGARRAGPVVSVAIQYRLHLLGFLANEELSGEQVGHKKNKDRLIADMNDCELIL
jgi:hypothetical protein